MRRFVHACWGGAPDIRRDSDRVRAGEGQRQRERSQNDDALAPSFIWKMAWRDSRSSRRRLLLFSISITLGIAALVAIGSFRHSLAQAIDDQARALIGADLVIESIASVSPGGGSNCCTR